jgi:uncharacterized protein (TIGR03437 family)
MFRRHSATCLLFILHTSFLAFHCFSQVTTTVAGSTWIFRGDSGSAVNAPLGRIAGVAVDSAGNVFAADQDNNLVVKVSTTGAITVVAGNGLQGFSGDGGPATSASLFRPFGVAVDAAGNLYIVDNGNFRVRKVSGGTISTVAGNGLPVSPGDGGPATSNSLSYPWGVAVDAAGNLYIADAGTNRVRKVSGGMISTVAGNGTRGFSGDGGPATSASLDGPEGVAVDAAGNLYIADTNNYRVRKVSGGTISTVAGNGILGFSGDGGPATSASLGAPWGVAVDAAGNFYLADPYNNRVRKVSGGTISTVAGNGTRGFSGDGGPATSASLDGPGGVAVDGAGNVYIADQSNQRVRRVIGGRLTTIGGNGGFKFSGDGGPATSASLNRPKGVAVGAAGNLYIADTENNRVREVRGGIISTMAGNGTRGFSGDGGSAVGASLYRPSDVAMDAAGNLYIADTENNRVRKVSGPTISTVAGNGTRGFSGDSGPATNASLNRPKGVAVDAAGNLYIADTNNHRVRMVRGGTISTVAGSGDGIFAGDGGLATNAALSAPEGVAVDAAGSLYIADTGNSRVRKVSGGTISTVAGNGTLGFSGDGGPATSAPLNFPRSVAVDSAGNLYIAETADSRVRKVSGGTISTVAGNATRGYYGDGGPATRTSLNFPEHVAVDAAGNLYIADTENDRIRKVAAAAPSFSVAPASLGFSVSAGAPRTVAQQVAVSSVAGLAWDARASTASGGNWLSLSTASGSVPGLISVSVDATGLAAGSYQGSITVMASSASPPTQVVLVFLTVHPALPAQLSVEPVTFSFEAQAGAGNPAPQTLRISNPGGGALSWTAQGDASWLSLSATSGSASASSPATMLVNANVAGLGAGVYSGSVRVDSTTTSETKNITVTLLVSQPAQTILLSQSGLLFSAVEGGGVEPPQSFGILNTGQGAMNWTAEANTLSGGAWLSVSPTSGSSVASSLTVPLVEVSASVTGLRAGQYSGLVRIVVAGANNSPQFVTVTLNVLPPGSPPPLFVRPTGLVFVRHAGPSSPGSQTVRLATAVTRTVEAVSSVLTGDGGNWLEALPRNLAFSTAAPGILTVQPTLGDLAAGEYRGALTILVSDGAAQTVNVLFVVTHPAGAGALVSLTTGAGQACTPQRLYAAVRSLPNGFASAVNWSRRVEVQLKDDCDNLIPNATVTASFSNGDPPLTLVSLRNGIYEATWSPVHAAPVRVTVRAEATPLVAETSVDGVVSGNVVTTPALFPGGVVHGASYTTGALAPGSIVSVFGRNLTPANAHATDLPLPTTLGEATLTVSGTDAPLFFSTASQINAQLPFELTANSRVQVVAKRANAAAVPELITLAAARPGIFTTNQQGTGQGAIFNERGQLVDSSAPAVAGDIVQVYSTGLGATQPPVKSGVAAPVQPLALAAATVTATVGGRPATVQFAGLAPGFVGLYQVNVRIPAGMTPGPAVPLAVLANGVPSNTVTMAVR